MIGLIRLSKKKNKNKIKSLANTTLDKFLKITVTLNIISIAKTKETIVKKNDTTSYNNYYLIINNTIDISKLV